MHLDYFSKFYQTTGKSDIYPPLTRRHKREGDQAINPAAANPIDRK
jgi:hypothetical protein